ncbi:TPA: hypothetical protein N0F65_007457 [Lagenidium giganteum]|uniref:Uncharacterized protein n=1 Tax=Lagenidium giganteum TaxID=4803 RepID=A0AAV2ZIG8_9STRA|nr:TPA: hypothetical protein N0F65_007457 [Lagenidium giganteum]
MKQRGASVQLPRAPTGLWVESDAADKPDNGNANGNATNGDGNGNGHGAHGLPKRLQSSPNVTVHRYDRPVPKRFSWRDSRKSPRKYISSQPLRMRPSSSYHARPSDRMSSPLTATMSSQSMVSRQVSSVHVERQIVRSGWLLKQSDVLRAWKRRFFVLIKRTNTLTGDFTASLQYYKGTKLGKLRGEVSLQDGPVVIRFLDVSEIGKRHCFEISKGEITQILQGMDEEDVSAWVCHLQSLSDIKTETSATHATSRMLSSAGSMIIKRGRTATAMDDRGICIVAELRRLLHNTKSFEAVKCKDFVKNLDFRDANPLRSMREFHASMSEAIMKTHSQRILELVEERKDADSIIEGLEEIGMEEIRSNVSRHVEEVIYVPLQEAVLSYLNRLYNEDEMAMNRKLRWLQGKDQTYFNIPLHHVSWKQWRTSSKCLSKMTTCTLPTAKYDVILATIKTIQETFAEELNKILDSEPPETDDIIPIFTYVLANSGLDNLLSLKVLLTELNGAWAVGGLSDEGVGLSIFCDAVDFISEVTIPAALEDIFKDQITLAIDGDWRRILEFEVEPTYRYGAIVNSISQHGYSAVGATVSRGHVLVSANGQNVVLWPFQDILSMLKESNPPHRFAFIPGNSYFRILTSNKSLWNVALVHACQRGDVGSVQMLLANGADVNYVADECGGNTPLHVAVSALHFNVASYVLQHGAKVKSVGEYGRTALHMVGAPCCMPSTSSSSTPAVLGSVLKNQSLQKYRPEDRVVMIVRKLIHHGAPLETVDMYGNTPLMLLAEKGCMNGIDALVEASGKLDINGRNWYEGMSALALAAKEGKAEVVEALLDYGAIVDIRTLRGETPLHFAAAIASKPICKLLIEKGSDVEARTVDGLTPLMVAAGRGRGVTLRPERTNERSQSSQSLVEVVDRNTHVDTSSVIETIDYLLEQGADKESVCNLYRLPLHFAALSGSAENFNHLLNKMNKDVDGHVRDIYGRTAISMVDWSDEDDESEAAVEKKRSQSLLCGEAPVSYENVLTEEKDGVVEIVAGTFDDIASVLLRCEDYHLEEVDALVRYCDYCGSYKEIIDFLRKLLKKSVGTLKGFFVRRMVLHALDKVVENMKHRVQCDMDVCNYISDFCDELFPFSIDDDPQCAQWLSSSLLPLFVEACRTERMHEFQILTSCEQDYTSLKQFLCSAKQKNPSLKFLDDELFASAPGLEIISESMRRRLSIAGVLACDTKKSFALKNPSKSPERTSERPKPTARMSALDRVARLWILDIDANVIAQQITLLQHYLFSKIKVSEILAPKKDAEKTPAFDRLRQLHNHISVWVVSQVLAREEVDQRAQILSYFIKVASVCLHPLQNYDGFMAVMNATNDSSLFRLKKTWGKLSPQSRDLWHELKKYTENGARQLNRLTKNATPPCIPYMGVIIQNVLALQEYPDRVEDDLINFKKIRFIGILIQNMLECQRTPYLLPTEQRVLALQAARELWELQSDEPKRPPKKRARCSRSAEAKSNKLQEAEYVYGYLTPVSYTECSRPLEFTMLTELHRDDGNDQSRGVAGNTWEDKKGSEQRTVEMEWAKLAVNK